MRARAMVAVTGLACVVAAGGGLVGCGGGGKDGGERTADAEGEAAVREVEYTTRGIVQSLPTETDSVRIYHEAIPEYETGQRNEAGEMKLGMQKMEMPFPAPEGYDWGELSVGDKVRFTFCVEYDAEDGMPRSYEMVSHEVLPVETQLDLTPLGGMDGGTGDTGGGGDASGG